MSKQNGNKGRRFDRALQAACARLVCKRRDGLFLEGLRAPFDGRLSNPAPALNSEAPAKVLRQA